MKCLDLTLNSPAENLAGDEALLDWCESGQGAEVLRFWESPDYFVVVGYANKVATEVNATACAARGVPVLRRCSGGGTVVQGPGCLNYALVLRIESAGPLQNISAANQFIMERNREALEALSGKPVKVQGHTDVAIGGLKFSGNSQRRRKNFLLFHGSLLLDFDLALVSELLPMPTLQPDYRQSRTHGNFLMNLKLPVAEVKAALQKAWHADDVFGDYPKEIVQQLVAEKYSTGAWNLKF